jgi:hypothetical protein
MSVIQTSLGYPLIKSEGTWEINLSGLEIFTGLSVLSKIIGEHIIEQVENNPGDVSFIYKINPNINPELIKMNILYIQVYAKAGVLRDILNFKLEFHEQIITIFGTFQRPSWRRIIHPARLAVSGVGIGPGVYDLFMILGKDEVIQRIQYGLNEIPKLIDQE